MEMNMILAFLVFYPMIGALVSYIIGRFHKTARDYFADFIVISEFAVTLYLFCTFDGSRILSFSIDSFAGLGIGFVLDGFRSVYTLTAALMWMMTTVFSKEYFKHYHNRNRYYLFMLLTLGATMGVFLSADLYTTFIFFEMMSFTSYVWVAHDERKASLRAAETYLSVAVIGGMAMLMGLFLLYHELGTLEIAALLRLAKACPDKTLLYVAGGCITLGFGAKAGVFPLHIWLPKAHPVAPAPASALLSGILTKSGIFGMIVVSCNLLYGDGDWGSVILLLGCITMFGGALLALFSVDLKRTLACSSMSQIGFVTVGIGIQGLLGEENTMAAMGTLLHMVNHSLIKLVLFMAAGVVFMNVHMLNLNEIRGFGRKKPLLHFIFLMGALGIGGIPLWNGYISKTLLHESIVEYTQLLKEGVLMPAMFGTGAMKCIEWIFLISGGMTVAYMVKLYVAVFIEKNSDADRQERFDGMKQYMNWQSKLALTVSAVLLPLMGCLPGIIMDFLAKRGIGFMNAEALGETVHYFSINNLKGALISVIIGAALYGLILRPFFMRKTETGRIYVNLWPSRLDLEDHFYRPLIVVLCAVCGFFARVCDSLVDGVVVLLRKTVYRDKALPFELSEGTVFTYQLGRLMNKIEEWIEKKFPNEKRRHHEFIHELAMIHLEIRENRMVITRSLSFGLILFCVGLILTTVYLLIVYK